VVDDVATGITHVIRGPQGAAETAIQIDLFEALNAPRPALAHLPPLADDRSAAIGRKAGAMTLRSLRADGVMPAALALCLAGPAADASAAAREDVVAALERAVLAAPVSDQSRADAATPGTNAPAVQQAAWLPVLAAGFTLPRGPASTPFESARLLRTNRRLLAAMPFPRVADRLPAGATEAFWLALRGQVDLLSEARGWWEVVAGTIVPPVIEGAQSLLHAARATLPPEPWDPEVFAHWCEALAAATGEAPAAFEPVLRLALTGEETGPALSALLPLMGRTRAALRLQVAAS